MTINLYEMGKAAKKAATFLRKATTAEKNTALYAMASALRAHEDEILAANQADVQNANAKGTDSAMVERLTLNSNRLDAMAKGLEDMAVLPDPIGLVDKAWINEDGLEIIKKRVPIGVIGIIYESRPNVTSDSAGLCFKSGNVVILRGGKETLASNMAIVTALHEGLESVNMPKEAIQYISDPSRELASQFMKLTDYIDCLIPRGGIGLINAVKSQATVPVIETGAGVCHIYVESSADYDMAKKIILNSKTQRTSVCNALDSLIIERAFAEQHLSRLLSDLNTERIIIHGDQSTQAAFDETIPATDDLYDTEFLSMDLAVRVVDDYAAAIEHIQTHSTGHTDAIITNDYSKASAFTQDIDSAAVMVNASTRFTDGGVFGFGGEIGISTQKLHARGPMGLSELTSYKYIVLGSGQVRK